MGRFLLAVPALLILAWLAAISLQDLRADAPLRESHQEIEAWSAGGIRPSTETWSAIYAELERAARLDEGNPTVHEMLGHLASRRTDSAEYMQRSRVHFSRALELRPVSPYTWASVAEAQYLQGEIRGLFETAIARAVDLGPAEPGVQRTIAHYGLAVWDEVPDSTRNSIDRVVGAGMRRDPGEMLTIAGRRGRLPIACRHLESLPRTADPKWLRTCQGTEATS